MRENSKRFHYTYLISNLVNGKQYIGDRSCDCFPESDPYLGSGVYLKQAQGKYGKENFKKEILELFETKQEAYNAQEKYIKKFNTVQSNGYNISPKGGLGVPGSYHNEETKKKISLSNMGRAGSPNNKFNFGNRHTDEAKEKIRLSHKGKKQSKEHIEKRFKNLKREYKSGKDNPLYGRHHTDESKEKISLSLSGKKLSEEHRKKISEGAKKIKRPKIFKKCPYCGKTMDHLNFGRYHGKKCKNYINSLDSAWALE
jgi:group I intron endonuclease